MRRIRFIVIATFICLASRLCTSPLAADTPVVEALPTTTTTLESLNIDPADDETQVCFSPRVMMPFAFTPDSSGIMINAGAGVQVIDLSTGQENAFYTAPQRIVTATLSPDGETLAWSLEDTTIQLVRVSDGEIIGGFEGHPDIVFDLQFSPTGDLLFSASHDGWVRIWDVDKAVQIPSIYAGREILGFGISPDGVQLALIPGDGPVQLWKITDDQEIAELGGTGGYDTSDAEFSPDGQYLAADLATGIYLWSISNAELVWNEVNNSMAVAFSPDGHYLAYSDINDNNNVTLVSPDGKQIIRTIEGTQGPIFVLFFSPDGSLLAATDGIEIRIWQASTGRLLIVGKATCS